MKKLMLVMILLASGRVFAAQSEELKMCMETCMAYNEPGYALKACVYQCLADQEEREQQTKVEKFCETYEDCDGLF